MYLPGAAPGSLLADPSAESCRRNELDDLWVGSGPEQYPSRTLSGSFRRGLLAGPPTKPCWWRNVVPKPSRDKRPFIIVHLKSSKAMGHDHIPVVESLLDAGIDHLSHGLVTCLEPGQVAL